VPRLKSPARQYANALAVARLMCKDRLIGKELRLSSVSTDAEAHGEIYINLANRVKLTGTNQRLWLSEVTSAVLERKIRYLGVFLRNGAAHRGHHNLTARNFTTGYSYDAASNRTGFTDPENGSTTYAYDALNRLQTLTPPSTFSGTGSFGFTYDALSSRTQMTRPNNVATNYAYDNLSRLQSVLHQLAGNTIDGATYTVDNAGNRSAKTDQHAGVTSNYGYDAILRANERDTGHEHD
jgi:YD repeat-containing protein